jgi:hypothetical protein
MHGLAGIGAGAVRQDRRTAPSLVRALVQESCGAPTGSAHAHDEGQGANGAWLPAEDCRWQSFASQREALETIARLSWSGLARAVAGGVPPDLDLVVDLVPCEDGHAQERTLMALAQRQAQPGELWLADRNFISTRRILCGLHGRGSSFTVREHGRTPNPQPLGPAQYQGRIEAGAVYEQAVDVEDDAGQRLRLRRVELHLDRATEEGDTTIRLLSNLPTSQFTPRRMARLYRQRWQIESLFQRLESVLHSEVVSLGNPRAALLAFGVAVLAYNTLAVLQSAVWRAHDLHTGDLELSSYYIADEIRTHYAGMMMAVAPAALERYDRLTSAQLARMLLQMARHANPMALRKHPRSTRSETKKCFVSGAILRRHVATARVLKDGFVK